MRPTLPTRILLAAMTSAAVLAIPIPATGQGVYPSTVIGEPVAGPDGVRPLRLVDLVLTPDLSQVAFALVRDEQGHDRKHILVAPSGLRVASGEDGEWVVSMPIEAQADWPRVGAEPGTELLDPSMARRVRAVADPPTIGLWPKTPAKEVEGDGGRLVRASALHGMPARHTGGEAAGVMSCLLVDSGTGSVRVVALASNDAAEGSQPDWIGLPPRLLRLAEGRDHVEVLPSPSVLATVPWWAGTRARGEEAAAEAVSALLAGWIEGIEDLWEALAPLELGAVTLPLGLEPGVVHHYRIATMPRVPAVAGQDEAARDLTLSVREVDEEANRAVLEVASRPPPPPGTNPLEDLREDLPGRRFLAAEVATTTGRVLALEPDPRNPEIPAEEAAALRAHLELILGCGLHDRPLRPGANARLHLDAEPAPPVPSTEGPTEHPVHLEVRFEGVDAGVARRNPSARWTLRSDDGDVEGRLRYDMGDGLLTLAVLPWSALPSAGEGAGGEGATLTVRRRIPGER